jgi:hypothetical protein
VSSANMDDYALFTAPQIDQRDHVIIVQGLARFRCETRARGKRVQNGDSFDA